ncbi:MAG: tRNA (adenosine(37)-N6)-dimethylallyltransferase MiaA [Bacilli bacterium]
MVIVITGPTCVGKTKASVELAKLIDGEVINADSTQIFRKLDIATAKTTEEEKENIPHHLFDIKDIDEDYSVFDYQRDCRKIIDNIIKRGKTPILCGGTGLYIKACLYNYEFKEQSQKSDFSALSDLELFNKLKEIDADTEIHMNNRKRVERALDYFNETGELLGKIKSDELLYDTIFIGLTTERNILYERINKRVDIMLSKGLLEEAKEVYDSNIRSKAVLTPIGYKELFPYFENKETFENCIDLVKRNSRRYAKKQYTWFNNQLPIKWINVNFDNFDETIMQIKKEINLI